MKLTRRRRIAGAVVSAVASIPIALASATPAHAMASSCWTGQEGSYSWAHCSSGSGYYRAYAQCKPNYWWLTWSYVTGPWVWVGGTSIANCPSGRSVLSYGINYG